MRFNNARQCCLEAFQTISGGGDFGEGGKTKRDNDAKIIHHVQCGHVQKVVASLPSHHRNWCMFAFTDVGNVDHERNVQEYLYEQFMLLLGNEFVFKVAHKSHRVEFMRNVLEIILAVPMSHKMEELNGRAGLGPTGWGKRLKLAQDSDLARKRYESRYQPVTKFFQTHLNQLTVEIMEPIEALIDEVNLEPDE